MYPKNQTFFILGLSRSGTASAEFLLSKNANVYIYDEIESDRMEQIIRELVSKGAKRVQKETLRQAMDVSDVLVLSPGIPIDHPLAVAFKRNKKAVVGETELASRYMRCPIIAVTGTNGKTTTVSMLTETLLKQGMNAVACGNIGSPMIQYCNLDTNGVAVAEISSFQMETLNSLCPHVSVVLNITQDHLNRHYNMENYVFLKAKLLKNATESEYAVLNYDDTTVRSFAERTKAQVVWFSVREKVRGAYYENGDLYFYDEKILSAKEMLAEGVHNIQNALAVIATAKIFGVKTKTLASALAEFKGIKHRIEKIDEVDGVLYIDDSKGTNVDATLKAVECMNRKTLLLLGGKNKGYDYSKLFSSLKNSNVIHAILYGENRYALLKSAREQGFESVTVCETFAFATKIAIMLAKSGQAVLLSPASASFDEFASYEERGDAFVEIVRTLKRKNETEKSTDRETVGKIGGESEEANVDESDDGSDNDCDDEVE